MGAVVIELFKPLISILGVGRAMCKEIPPAKSVLNFSVRQVKGSILLVTWMERCFHLRTSRRDFDVPDLRFYQVLFVSLKGYRQTRIFAVLLLN